MELKGVDIEKIKHLTGIERLNAIEEYKEERANLFNEYMKLQDILEEYNEKSYQVCCKIERLNIILTEMGVRLQ